MALPLEHLLINGKAGNIDMIPFQRQMVYYSMFTSCYPNLAAGAYQGSSGPEHG